MPSLSTVIFSWRMRLTQVKNHKLGLALSLALFLAVLLFGPLVYQESWLDPFSTLDVSNSELKPHAITMLGILSSDDPFHPYYYTDAGEIQELLRDLRRATPLPSTAQTLNSLKNQKILYYTLHRQTSKYHAEEDFALQYYPEKSIVCFGDQLFKINEASQYLLTKIYESRTSGWWK